MKTNSYFVDIIEKDNVKYIKRRKRKGIKPYARTLKLKQIDKILKNSDIKRSKLLKNRFNYVIEEYIETNSKVISNEQYYDYFIEIVTKLNSIDIEKYKKFVKWNNNSEFMSFQINNLKEAIKIKKLDVDLLNRELTSINTKMDDDRKLSFIHGDLHLNNVIVNDNGFYLIDWEMATIGDIAYELAMHFILMDYTNEEEKTFIDKLNINIDKFKLINDINEYKKFEMIRRNILHGNTLNHFH